MNKPATGFVRIASALLALTVGEGFAMDGSPSFPNPQMPHVYPTAETEEVDSADDAADDPAIWVNPFDISKSVILGTDKQKGLAVYDLSGKIIQFLPSGRLNNVDIRTITYASNQGAESVVVAAASDRDDQTIALFTLDATTQLVSPAGLSGISTGLTEVYGICIGSYSGSTWIFINDKDGRYQQWDLSYVNGAFDTELVREFSFDTQPEGCVVDDARGWLYAGEEGRGIWKLRVEPTSELVPVLLAEVGSSGLVADVEGMSIYDSGEEVYLVVSSQRDFSYALFDILNQDRYVGSFQVVDLEDGSLDGAQETDGLDVVSTPLGSSYPAGLMVVQDGFNTLPDENQNFKMVSWKDIAETLGLSGH